MKPCKWLSIVWVVSEICHVLVVADTEILVNEPKGNCKTWAWYISPHSISGGAGWISPSREKVFYTVCDIQSTREPKNWLRTGFIPLNDSKLLEIKIGYRLKNCPDDSTIRNCKVYLTLCALHTNKRLSTNDSDPGLVEYEFVDRITPGVIPKPGEVKEFTYHGKLITKAKGVYLAFLDKGVCMVLQSFTLSFKFCSERGRDLLTFPRTVAPASDSQLVDIAGNCGENSHSLSEDKITGVCLSSGKWNITGGGKCLCANGFELVESQPNFLRCKACSRGTYNDGKGLNCTVIPSEPRAASVSFVNESSAVITWFPPAVTGTQTDLMYDVDCRKSCTYFGEDCDDERCDSDFNALLKGTRGLNFTINNLASFVNYTCKISAKNRVSEEAEKIAKFTLVNLRTVGSVPGKPDLTIHLAEDGAIELSWKLSCKNGIIQVYRVVYFKVDDSSDTEILKTKETEIRITSLAPGETFEFRVFVVNNFGTGPPGTKTFKMPGGGSSPSQFIYIVISIVLGIILLIVLTVFGVYCYCQR